MIGPWDNTGCVLAIAPNAWGNGNGTSDQNIGEFPGYPDGSYNATLTNMAAGYGYVYNAGDAYLRWDGINDSVLTALDLGTTNANSYTLEFKINIATAGKNQLLLSQYDAADDRVQVFIDTGNTVWFLINQPGQTRYAQSVETLSVSTDHTVHVVKNAGSMKLYIDGSEVTYANQDTYNLGTLGITRGVDIGHRTDNALTYDGKMYWIAVYNIALSNETITTNAGLNNRLGLIGESAADAMSLLAGVVEDTVIDPDGAIFGLTQTVAITTATAGATIYYTTDGNDPTVLSTEYSAPFVLSDSACVKSIAAKAGYLNSGITSAIFYKGTEAKVSVPTIVTDNGDFNYRSTVTLSTETEDATIYYTTDGSTPDENSTEYTEPFTFSGTKTVKAIGIKIGLSNSNLLVATVTLDTIPSADEIKVDKIIDNMVTSLGIITTANGYNNDIGTATRDINDYLHAKMDELPAAMVFYKRSDELGNDDDQADFQTTLADGIFTVRGKIYSKTDREQAITAFMQDVHRAVCNYPTRGGYAITTLWSGEQIYDGESANHAEFDINFRIRYYFKYGNP